MARASSSKTLRAQESAVRTGNMGAPPHRCGLHTAHQRGTGRAVLPGEHVAACAVLRRLRL